MQSESTPTSSTEPAPTQTSPPSTPSPVVALPRIAGFKWALVHVKTATLSFAPTPPYPFDTPELQFMTDGKYDGSDGLNGHSGDYSMTPTGFTTSNDGVTFLDYAGHDQHQVAIQSSYGAIFNTSAVTVTSDGPTMIVLSVPGYALTFRKNGAATNA